MSFSIDPDIARASTLPAEVYRDPAWFERQRELVFARTWHLVSDTTRLAEPGSVQPFTLLPDCLDEPLLLTHDEEGALHCLSNVCTHRGALVARRECKTAGLRCPYHGRRFRLDGGFTSMPEFEEAVEFPSPTDDLPRLPLGRFGPFLFTSLDPSAPFEEVIEPLRRRVEWFPWDDLVLDPETSRSYHVGANWALYCDNYLEGFHIPYVHGGLNAELDYGSYRTEVFPWLNLQLGIAKGQDADEPTFDLPEGHPDAGEPVAAYYFWIFPGTMFNLYPWGLSLNLVLPRGHDRTQVTFASYVLDPEKRGRGAGGDLHQVELEDELLVEEVQRGVGSRLYDRGRYSPTQERGVHHFHRLLAHLLCEDGMT